MTDRRHVAVYRRLVLLYPPSFRRAYGPDLVTLFADQLRDEGAAAVWLRTVRDLLVSVPTQRLEADMSRPSPSLVTGCAVAVAAGSVVAATAADSPPPFFVFLGVAAVAVAIALLAWQSSRPVRADGSRPAVWWKVLLSGPALAACTFALTAVPWPDAVDLGDNAYWLVFWSFALSLALVACGVVLGAGTLLARRRSHLG
ncbi:MAG TPA: hypothetical protein VFJ85_18755 [Acidimicrobiales bacterium]|nr:hypothetical protein [Acidimicrobiales bacterium]